MVGICEARSRHSSAHMKFAWVRYSFWVSEGYLTSSDILQDRSAPSRYHDVQYGAVRLGVDRERED